MDRIILHSDINSCFANIECLYRPELRGKPVSVCGSVEERHGIILASTIEAKRFGVKTGEAIWQAKQKCPDLITLTPNYDRYVRFSKLSRDIYADYTDRVEPFGLDEAFLDVTGNPKAFSDGYAIADEIRKRIKFELGVTVSIGASYNKIFAKLGSDMKKPDAVTTITRSNYRDKVWPLPVGDLLYVGRSTKHKLSELGISTIGDLANAKETILNKQLGKMGSILYSFANGYDRTAVALHGESSIIKSISNGTTPPRDIKNMQDARIILMMLSESVAERLREHGFFAGVVQINYRDTSLNYFQKQIKLGRPTSVSTEILEKASELLQQSWSFSLPLRSITVGAADLCPENTPSQISIFENEHKRIKREKLELAIDDVRRRFGHYSIARAITHLDDTLGKIDAKGEHVSYPVGFFKEYSR